MAKYINIEKVKTEIERLGEIDYPYSYERCVGFYDALDRIENIIASFNQEQSSLFDNLDEAAEKYSNVHYYETMLEGDLAEGFKAGAEWRYQKDRGEFAKIKAKTWNEGFDACKEQMLKDAVEGVARPDDCEIWVNLVGYGYKFNDGDKVKIIIVKEDKG